MNDLRERVARAIAGAGGTTIHQKVAIVDVYAAADAAIAATKLEREVFVLRDGELISEMEPVPATSNGKPCCTLCETPLDQPGRHWTRSCGGDCLACMADAGDPDCVAEIAAAGVGEVPADAWAEWESLRDSAVCVYGPWKDQDAMNAFVRRLIAIAPPPPAPPETGEVETAPASTETTHA
jgi:hypothetical protein